MKQPTLSSTTKFFKLLGHSKRLEILLLLRGHNLTVGQIASMTLLRQATVSQHLRLLKSARLVHSEVRGKEIYYHLLLEPIKSLVTLLQDLTHTTSPLEPKVTDPVCHMVLTPARARYKTIYNGVCHYFCGRGCYQSFNQSHL